MIRVTTVDVLVLGYGLWVRVWARVWVRVWVKVWLGYGLWVRVWVKVRVTSAVVSFAILTSTVV